MKTVELYTPPPFVERFQYKNCIQKNNFLTRKRVYETPDGEILPSVTTILDVTKDKTSLNAWVEREGVERANKIKEEAAKIGTALHNNLEKFICGVERKPGNNSIHVKANAMANKIIEGGLTHVDEVVAIEQSLYFPGLYSGTTDLVAVYKGNLSVCDYKQSSKLKTVEYIEDYFLQLVSYILAHNEVYGTDIREGHIFLCTRGHDNLKLGGETYQPFDLLPQDFNKYQDMWLDRVEKFYSILM